MRILVAIESIDGRKGIDSLDQLCREKLDADPFSGCLFIFRSRSGKSIRILAYDSQGFWLERRDREFESKMAKVLPVYQEVEIVNAGLLEGTLKEPSVVTISYDEKPGIQALATTTPDRPPAPNQFASHLRDYEYKRLGTVSLLAGLDLHTGRVTEIVSDHHASADFIGLLGKLDESYPPQTRIRLLLDNHSAHISKETHGWLSVHPQRFEFVFTPKHGSWLNIVETLFSKMARSMLRGIRVASKQELIDRIHLYFDQLNEDPLIFRWKYKMDETRIG